MQANQLSIGDPVIAFGIKGIVSKIHKGHTDDPKYWVYEVTGIVGYLWDNQLTPVDADGKPTRKEDKTDAHTNDGITTPAKRFKLKRD